MGEESRLLRRRAAHGPSDLSTATERFRGSSINFSPSDKSFHFLTIFHHANSNWTSFFFKHTSLPHRTRTLLISFYYPLVWLYNVRYRYKMSRHHPDLVMCRKQPGISIGRLCDKCDGKCPVCDSYVRPTTLVRICDECSFGNYQNKCIVCGGEGISDAFYCFECTRLEKDRDGCPKIINLGSSRTDLFYQKKNFRNH